MKTQELRIGNLIRYSEPDFIVSVNGVSECDGCVVPLKDINGMECEHWGIESFEGIPLTEEWLLKFGYIKSGLRFTGKPVFDLFGYSGKITYKIDDGQELILKYVHQLQNLFFALTGEELTAKQVYHENTNQRPFKN